jgi:hypothetical protein
MAEAEVKVQVSVNGKVVTGETVNFKPMVEPWAEYLLEDSNVIRFRATLTRVVKTEEKDPNSGEPIYVTQSHSVSDVEVKD